MPEGFGAFARPRDANLASALRPVCRGFAQRRAQGLAPSCRSFATLVASQSLHGLCSGFTRALQNCCTVLVTSKAGGLAGTLQRLYNGFAGGRPPPPPRGGCGVRNPLRHPVRVPLEGGGVFPKDRPRASGSHLFRSRQTRNSERTTS